MGPVIAVNREAKTASRPPGRQRRKASDGAGLAGRSSFCRFPREVSGAAVSLVPGGPAPVPWRVAVPGRAVVFARPATRVRDVRVRSLARPRVAVVIRVASGWTAMISLDGAPLWAGISLRLRAAPRWLLAIPSFVLGGRSRAPRNGVDGSHLAGRANLWRS